MNRSAPQSGNRTFLLAEGDGLPGISEFGRFRFRGNLRFRCLLGDTWVYRTYQQDLSLSSLAEVPVDRW